MPKSLYIFDFDMTLFRSPSRPSTWPPERGWWGSPESLTPPWVPEHPGPDWWISHTVADARAALNDPNGLAVVVTGRLKRKFEHRIKQLLAQAGLHFPAVYLAPGGLPTEAWKKTVIQDLAQKIQPDVVEIWEDRLGHLSGFLTFVQRKLKLEAVGHPVYADAMEALPVDPTVVAARYLGDV